MAEEVLELTDEGFLGAGHQRVCFRHPTDTSLCVKVLKPRRSAERQQRQELRELRKVNYEVIDGRYVAPFLGCVSTNRGLGYLFSMVANSDGSAALTLGEYLKLPECDGKLLTNELLALKSFFLNSSVIFRDVNVTNILCPKDAEGRVFLVVIDGLGDRVDFPISLLNHIPFLVRKKIRRRWSKFVTPIVRANVGVGHEVI